MRGKKETQKKLSQEELEGLKNKLVRALADYDNLRKRVEKERQDLVKFASLTIVVKLLPVLDMLEKAQNHLEDSGLAIAIGELKRILSEEEIVEIRPSEGDKFDTQSHEAVESAEGGKKGFIAELVLPGFKFSDGKVIRYAKVKVYGEKTTKDKELDKEMARGDYV